MPENYIDQERAERDRAYDIDSAYSLSEYMPEVFAAFDELRYRKSPTLHSDCGVTVIPVFEEVESCPACGSLKDGCWQCDTTDPANEPEPGDWWDEDRYGPIP